MLKSPDENEAETQPDTKTGLSSDDQCFVCSRNIGWFTPKIIYFHHLEKYLLDQSIQKDILFSFEKGSTADD